MVPRTLMQRVEKLENTIQSLVGLPAAVGEVRERTSALESQIVQLRSEMKDEFSAVRRQMADLRVELKSDISSARQDFTILLAQTRDSLSSQMLMLHEDLVSRIALIAEGRPTRKPRRRH